ncbi:hypothetical protein ABK040_003282 [Willaertia magna]
MQALERNLSDLHSVLTDEKAVALLNPISIINDMNDFCSRITSDDIGLVSSVIFHEQKGIFNYLDKSLTLFPTLTENKTISLSRKAIFEFLLNYIKIANKKILEYTFLIKKWCVLIFRRESSNQVKLSTIPPLIKLLEILMENDYYKFLNTSSSSNTTTTTTLTTNATGNNVTGMNNNDNLNMSVINNNNVMEQESSDNNKSLNIKEMFLIYFREFQRLGATGNQTLKGKILHLLGVLSEYFPGETLIHQQNLLNLMMNTLLNQSKKSKPEPQLIASTFRGLTHFLTQFGGSVEEGSSYIKPLYGLLTTSLELLNETRYDVPKAALLLLSKHAEQFKEYLTVDSEKMFDRLVKLCSHRNDKVRKHAFPALESFLSQVSFELVREGGRRLESNIKTFKNLMTKFKGILSMNFTGLDISNTGTANSSSGGNTTGPVINPNLNKYYLSIAIRSFGQFAVPMARFLSQQDTKIVLKQLLKLSDQLLTRSQEQLEESVSHIPSFLSAFANIILELESVDSWVMDYLEKITGILFLVYPKQYLFPKYKYANYCALVKLLVALYLKRDALNVFLDRIVFQGITLTISSSQSLVSYQDNSENNNSLEKTNLYEEYLDLWYNLLNPKNIKLANWNYPWTELSLSEEIQEHLHSILYDKIVEVSMQMISKFDLRCSVTNLTASTTNMTEVISSTATDALIPTNTKDFELFLNLIEFLKRFLKDCKPKHFLRWNFVFSKLLIEKSKHYSYVSGFYKLLSVAMKISEKYDYFEGINEHTIVVTATNIKEEEISQQSAGTMEIDDNTIEVNDEKVLMDKLFTVDFGTRVNCFNLLMRFVKENVIQRLHEFKGELLTSCIKFVLSMPKTFIDLKYWVNPLKLSFELGLSYLPLANVGLQALEHWLKVMPRNELIEKCLSEVLPLLNPYLMVNFSTFDIDEENSETLDVKKLLKSQTKTSIRKTEEKKYKSKIFTEGDKTPLKKVQISIIRLLGKIGGDNNLLLKGKVASTDSENIIAWDTEKRLKFSMPFRDIKPELFFDSILPRVAELAEKSSDRQTKIAACEFLHSIVLYMVGKNAYSPQARQRAQEIQNNPQTEESSEPTPYYKIYQKIFPVLLRLSVDTEQVTKQLFEPFIYQLTHWLTQNMQFENKETMALLDAIIDSMSHSGDGALRDQCASLLDEFLKWSIKHDKDGKFVNVKSLFQRLYSNIHHPNLFKRLGAVIAFNSMYRSFREVDSLVQRHVLDWLHNVIISLKIIDTLDEKSNQTQSLGLIEKSIALLGHIEKIIVHKYQLLLEPLDRRLHETLADAVEWVFNQCGNTEKICREQCMRLFPVLAVLLPGFEGEDGPRRWIHAQFKKDESKVLAVVDIQLSLLPTSQQLVKDEKKKNIKSKFTSTAVNISLYDRVMLWLSKLEASFDCLYWLFNNKFLYPHQLFQLEEEEGNKRKPNAGDRLEKHKKRKTTSEDDMEDNDDSVKESDEEHVASKNNSIMKHIQFFIEKYALRKPSESFLLNTSEEERYTAKKCSTIFKLFNFIGILMEKFPNTLLNQKGINIVKNEKFLDLLFTSMLRPGKLGFNTNQEDVQTILPRYTRRICDSLLHYSEQLKQQQQLGVSTSIVGSDEILECCKKVMIELVNQNIKQHITNLQLKKLKLNMDDYTFFFRGLRLLNRLHLIDDATLFPSYSDKQDFGTKIAVQLFQEHFDPLMSPVQLIICKELLQVCFDFGLSVEELIDFLITSTPTTSSEYILTKKLSEIGSSYQIMNDDDENNKKTPNNNNTSKDISRVKPSPKGSSFYKLFQTEIDTFISDHMESFAKPLLSKAADNPMLFSVLLSVGTKILRNNKKKVFFINNVMENIEPIFYQIVEKKDDDYKFRTMSLVEKLLQIDASTVLSHLSRKYIFDFILNCLTIRRDESNNNRQSSSLFDLKLRAIRVLPNVFKYVTEENELGRFLKQIKSVVIDEFPLVYEEIEVDSVEYDDHIALLEDLLYFFQNSESVEVLEQILPLFRWKNHPLQDKMSKALKQLFSKLSNEKLLKCSNICLETFYKESLPIDIRRQVIQWVCLTCLQYMPERILIEFYEANIDGLMKCIGKPTTLSEVNIPEDLLDAESVWALFVTRTCCFNLLEAMYRLLPASIVKEAITNKYQDTSKQNVKLTEKIMRSSFSARSWKPTDNELKLIGPELLLDFRTSAYNVLAGGVKCTQTQEKFYTGFLFKDKDGDLWDNIVDVNHEYKFEIETNFSFHRKAVDELRVDANQRSTDEPRKSRDLRIGYLSSQYLSDSSLSGSLPYVSSFLIPGSKYVDASAVASPEEISKEKSTTGTDNNEKKEESNATTLEMDELNQSPCMPAILRTIDHIHSTFVYSNKQVLPTWMTEIQKKLDDDSAHRNIKLFLAKVIVNRPAIFEPFGKFFFEPIIKTILQEEQNNETRGIHYFVRDLCILLLRWKDLTPPSTSKPLLTKLLSYLMKNCAHQKRIILKSNLELIKLFVEKWKDHISINKSIILGWLCHDASKTTAKMARSTGLQLLGVVIANDMPAYDPVLDANITTEEKFYDKVLDNILFQTKEVYEAAAEIGGMILTSLSKRNENVEMFEKLLLAKCQTFLQKMQYDRFLNCLYKIGIHDTAFIDHFLPTKILDILPNLYGVYKKIALQLITWRADHFPNLYTSFKPFIRQNLQHKDEPIQLLTLQMVYQLIKIMSKEDVLHFIETVTKYINISDVHIVHIFSEPCREKYYDILIWLFDNRSSEFRSEDIVRTELLKAMNDPSEDIRRKMLLFWDHESRLSIESMKRLEESFSVLYAQNLGDKWLQYSCYLMLQLIHRSPEFNDTHAIFSESLSNCEFKEYNIDTSWQNRSLPLTATSIVLSSKSLPQTYASLPENSDSMFDDPYAPSQSRNNNQVTKQPNTTGMVKATQSLQFTPTQMPETLKDILSAPSLSQTSLLFTPFKSIGGSNNNNNTTGNTSNSQQQQTQQSEMSAPFLRRRFLKLKESTMTQYQARRAVRLKREKEAWESRLKIARKNRITMYRKYRTGELPDIQIAIREVITPLQALCLSDVTVSKQLFTTIFNSLYPLMGEKLSAQQAILLRKSIHETMHLMFKQSPDSSLLISSLFSVCLEHEELQAPTSGILSPKLIRQVSLQSYNIELGILLLEHLIEYDLISNNTEDEARMIIEAWIELGKMYKSIDEEDIVRSIFEYHVAQQDSTKRALTDELEGRYNSALKTYGQGIAQWDNGWQSHDDPPLEEEVEFWREQRLECLRKMNQWDSLDAELNNDFAEDMDKIWSHENADYFLRLYIDSNLKINEKWLALQQFIENSMQNPQRREILENKFSDRLSYLSLFMNNYEKSKSYVADSYADFLLTWTALSPLAKTGRHNYLQKLQPLTEIEEFVNYLQSKSEQKPHKLLHLLKAWKSRFPSTYIDDINTWDNVVTNRNFMYESLLQHVETIDWSKQPQTNHMLIEMTTSLFGGENQQATASNSLFSNSGSLSLLDDFTADIHHQQGKQNSPLIDLENITKTIIREKANMYLIATKAARKQQNNAVAQTYLKIAQQTSKKLESLMEGNTNVQASLDYSLFEFEFHKALVKLLKVKATSRGTTTADSISNFEKLIRFTKQNAYKYEEGGNIPLKCKIAFKLLYADAYSSFGSCLWDRKVEKTSELGTRSDIINNALRIYNESIALIKEDKTLENNQISTHQSSKIYLKFALFCDDLLKNQTSTNDDDDEIKQDEKLPSREQLACNIVDNMLNAMKYHCKEARDRFPRLLELLEKYPTSRKIFTKYIPGPSTLQIPNWMFIIWISQMLAHLTGQEGEYLMPILISIAEHYPQSIYYPLNISSQDLLDKPQNRDKLSKTVLEGIDLMKRLVKNPLIETFIYSLQKLNHPELRYKSYMDEIKELLKTGKSKREILKKWEEAFDDLFDPNAPHVGVYNSRFAKNWVPQIKKDFGGRDGAKLLTMDVGTFDKLVNAKHKKMRETKGALMPGKTKLEYFSKWMFDFQYSENNLCDGNNTTTSNSSSLEDNLNASYHIEVPGQYTDSNVGVHKSSSAYSSPNIEEHVKVISFNPSLLTMGSIRKPKRIKIHGSDEKEYMFLVKGGEDLRQDQRIQQLFQVMNNILQQDSNCQKSELFIKMYKVIPMSLDVGIIEWVDNTLPLKAMIESELSKQQDQNQGGEVLKHPSTVIHMRMLEKIAGQQAQQLNQYQKYLLCYQKTNQEFLEQVMNEQYKVINPDLLRNSIQSLAMSQESYFTIRNKFCKTLSAFNICSYIIGIGDRHLENFLVHQAEGTIIGIDFGHAFGSATEVLPVPELLPFRLTRQLLSVTSPISTTLDDFSNENIGIGWYMENMVHVLSALHSNRHLLLNTMDVFIKEPLVDWLKYAKRNPQFYSESSLELSSSSNNSNNKVNKKEEEEEEEIKKDEQLMKWYPKRKVELARKKLELYNPVEIFKSDANANVMIKKGIKYIEKAIEGDPEINKRAKVGEICKSVKEQVECLIDLATDVKILGRTYIGWCPQF